MPGWELVGKEEKKEINDIFNLSNGVMMAHGFEDVRNNYYRVRSFEDKIKKKLKVNYCLATTSGTMAQYIAMKALGVKPGDEVITQAFTFIATIEAILALGAKPKIVNIDETYNMCLCDLKNKITRKTKLVIPVPMLGNQCRVNEIKKICSNYNIKILEDACESLGAKIYNKYVGTNSNIGVYSLDYAKTITTGEGGLIVTNNQILYNFCKEFHDHGHVNDGKIPRGLEKAKIPGLNLRMTEMQAAFGLAQLKKLDYIVKTNRKKKKLLKSLINEKKIKFREIVDEDNELADTIIFNFKKKKQALFFYKKYISYKYPVKILPNALNWHFAGKWRHIFSKNQINQLKKSSDLLSRSVALPILINQKVKDIYKQARIINSILKQINE
jgi:8-amino-3,8-dideoxy-alpha-D-manno-octulosonate transaminase